MGCVELPGLCGMPEVCEVSGKATVGDVVVGWLVVGDGQGGWGGLGGVE